MHHDSKSPRYGGISQLPRTWSSGCLSVFPPALINIDLGTNGRTQKHAQRQQIARYRGILHSPVTPVTVGFACQLMARTL